MVTFTYKGAADQTAIVPAGIGFAEVRVIGGKGGGTFDRGDKSGKYTTGGDGAQVTGLLPVTAGQVLTVRVGGYGGDGNSNKAPGGGGWGATGRGGRGGSGSVFDAAGGGGASDIEVDGQPVVVAGGGGGAGGRGFDYNLALAGPGGSSGTSVDPGHNGKGTVPGSGGGGAANKAPAGGTGENGKSGSGPGGGGGAGVLGGAGGGAGGGITSGGGGGGAGSSLISPHMADASVARGTTSDGNGRVEITWLDAVPVCYDQTVTLPRNSPGVRVQLRCADTSRLTSFRIVTHPAHGRIEDQVLTRGTFTYVPAHEYGGRDSIRFQALTGTVASDTATVTFEVTPSETPMTLTASSVRVPYGDAPTFRVTMPTGATGHVGFYDKDQPGQDKGIGTAEIIDGVATLTKPTKPFAVGSHQVHASYDGDANYKPNDSRFVTVTVSPAIPRSALSVRPTEWHSRSR